MTNSSPHRLLYHPRSTRQLARSHDIARISRIDRLSCLAPIRSNLDIHHAQIVHALRRLIARGRIAIAQHGPKDPLDALDLVRLLRTAVVGRQVETHVADIRCISRRPDPGRVLHGRVGELGADGGDGFGGAGAEVKVDAAVVGEALDAVGSGGWGVDDGGVAGVAGWVGGGLVEGSAGVTRGRGSGRVVDSGVDA